MEIRLFNPYSPNVTFLYPLKTSENQKGVFRGYRNVTLGEYYGLRWLNVAQERWFMNTHFLPPCKMINLWLIFGMLWQTFSKNLSCMDSGIAQGHDTKTWRPRANFISLIGHSSSSNVTDSVESPKNKNSVNEIETIKEKSLQMCIFYPMAKDTDPTQQKLLFWIYTVIWLYNWVDLIYLTYLIFLNPFMASPVWILGATGICSQIAHMRIRKSGLELWFLLSAPIKVWLP